jgi:ABC-2 type transport system ATP-binding protein
MNATANAPAIEHAIWTDGLRKTYKGLDAVNGLDLRVPRGAIYGFLGRNGAGKTTTIRTLLGLARATAGSAHVLGMDIVRGHLAILERTAFVGEHKILYDNFTTLEMVRFTRAFYPQWSHEMVERCAQRLELPVQQRFAKLSKGNRAKVWLLLALAQNADLLILDEPTTGLDPVANDGFLKLLVEDHAANGRSVFFSSHNLAEVEHVADWVGIIDQGRMLLEARLEDIRERFRLIIAAGRDLPAHKTEQVAAVAQAGQFIRYVVTRDAEAFASRLRQQGAAVTEVSPLSLREVFLELLRREKGESHVPVEMLA